MLTTTPEAPTRANFQNRPAEGTYQNRLSMCVRYSRPCLRLALETPALRALELEGHLDHPQLRGAHEDLEQHLEPRRPELYARDRLVAHQEEARHRVAGLARLLEDDLGQVLASHRDRPPRPAREPLVAAARGVAARHHDVGVAGPGDLAASRAPSRGGCCRSASMTHVNSLAAGEQLHPRSHRRREAALPLGALAVDRASRARPPRRGPGSPRASRPSSRPRRPPGNRRRRGSRAARAPGPGRSPPRCASGRRRSEAPCRCPSLARPAGRRPPLCFHSRSRLAYRAEPAQTRVRLSGLYPDGGRARAKRRPETGARPRHRARCRACSSATRPARRPRSSASPAG